MFYYGVAARFDQGLKDVVIEERTWRWAMEHGVAGAGSNLGVLLAQQGRLDESEQAYRWAIERDPSEANTAANLAQLLLQSGRESEGARYLDRTLTLVREAGPPQLLAELWFYAYAHRPSPGERREALRHLRSLIEAGARSPGWDLSGNVARARADGHPEAEWLERLAAVIADGADASVLDGWPAWVEAGADPETLAGA